MEIGHDVKFEEMSKNVLADTLRAFYPSARQKSTNDLDCTIPVPIIVLYLCSTPVSTLNSTELHLQGVAPRSRYSEPTPEAVTLQ